MITLDIHVEKRLGDFTLRADVVSGGRVTALFGRSGAGKSTLANLIAGLLRPDKGTIRVDGITLFDSANGIDVPAHRRRVGYVFQEGRLFPHLSVRGNLLYGRRFASAHDRWADFDEIVDLLGIGHLLARRPAGLSGGEKQRVAIGRALLASPRLLLMDEPLASLDQERKADILPFVERLRDLRRLPIVYVSHSVEEVSRIADTVVLLRNGAVVATGPVNQVLATSGSQGEAEDFDAGTVLTATVVAHDETGGITRLSHPAGDLAAPLLPVPPGHRARIRIRARDVALAIGEPGRISIRNRLAGTVTAIVPGPPPIVDIHLDIAGDPLIARITGDAARELALETGMKVTALVKSAAFDALSFGPEAVSSPPG